MSASGAMFASGVLDAGSSIGTAYSQSEALKSYGAYQESIGKTNAAMAELTGQQVLEAGDIAASRKDLETRQQTGAILASQAGSGVDVGSGSSALTRIGTNLVGGVDELTIRHNAQRQAFGYKIQGMEDIFAGEMEKRTAETQAKQTLISGGLQAISGPLSIYSNYLRWSRMGGGGTGAIPASYMGAT
jgi:hypothetical protein